MFPRVVTTNISAGLAAIASQVGSGSVIMNNATGQVILTSVSSNVGVNNPNPVSTLDVSGTGRFSDLLATVSTSNAGAAYTRSLTVAGLCTVSDVVAQSLSNLQGVSTTLLAVSASATTGSLSNSGAMWSQSLNNAGTLSSCNAVFTGLAVNGAATTRSLSNSGTLWSQSVSNAGGLSSCNAVFSGAVVVAGSMSNTGVLWIQTLSNAGALSANTAAFAGAVSMAGSLSVAGPITATGLGTFVNLVTQSLSNATGLTTASLAVSGAATTGSLSNSGVLWSQSLSNAGALSANSATFSGAVLLTGGFSNIGAIVATGQVVCKSVNTGNVTALGSVTVAGNTSNSATLWCQTLSNSGAMQTGSLAVSGAASIAGAVTLSNSTGASVLTTLGSNLGVNTSNPTVALHVIGSIYASGDITALSDGRFKTDLVPLPRCVDVVCGLTGYRYTRTDPGQDAGKRHVGLIAQEVLAHVPELVTYDSLNDGFSVNYGGMTAVLVNAMKEMKSTYDARLDLLEAEIRRLQQAS